MGLLSLASGAIQSIGLDDLVSDFLGSSLGLGGFVSDIIGGTVTNSAVAAIAGGDIGKAAIFGAAGGATGALGFNYAKELGAGVSGYGLDRATGGSGVVGALSGAAGQYLNETYSEKKASSGSIDSPSVGGGGAVGGAPGTLSAGAEAAAPVAAATGGSTVSDTLKKLGLVNDTGEGTLLGKALVAGIGGMAQEKSTKDLLEEQQKNAKDRDSHQANLEHENEQKRIAAFSGPQQFRIQR